MPLIAARKRTWLEVRVVPLGDIGSVLAFRWRIEAHDQTAFGVPLRDGGRREPAAG